MDTIIRLFVMNFCGYETYLKKYCPTIWEARQTRLHLEIVDYAIDHGTIRYVD